MNTLFILASGSPRRRQILRDAGFKFRIITPNSSERFQKNLTLSEALKKISDQKASRCLDLVDVKNFDRVLILSADTTVVANKQPLAKPKSRIHAQRMLRQLSGRTHEVKTAFTLLEARRERSRDQGQDHFKITKKVTRVVTTKVTFRPLSDFDISSYIDTGEPFDKAGAYAIQGKARKFVTSVKGDMLNVVGLPLDAVKVEIKKNGWVSYTRKSKSSARANRKR